MADTIIHNTRERNSGSAGEWVVTVVIVASIVIIGFMLFRAGLFDQTPIAAPTGGSADINVTLPATEVNDSEVEPAQ